MPRPSFAFTFTSTHARTHATAERSTRAHSTSQHGTRDDTHHDATRPRHEHEHDHNMARHGHEHIHDHGMSTSMTAARTHIHEHGPWHEHEHTETRTWAYAHECTGGDTWSSYHSPPESQNRRLLARSQQFGHQVDNSTTQHDHEQS